jgi:hypothetical protein
MVIARQMRDDESYIIGLCDSILKEKGSRQHHFDFLRGDSGRRLPVDAFYAEHRLAIEFHEKQHTEAVPFFDKRATVSGVPRGEQRKIYDQRRREVLPENGIALVVFSVQEFPHKRGKKLLRKVEKDTVIILKKLKDYMKL